MKKQEKDEIYDLIMAYIKLITVPTWFASIVFIWGATSPLDATAYIKIIGLTLMLYALIIIPVGHRIKAIIDLL